MVHSLWQAAPRAGTTQELRTTTLGVEIPGPLCYRILEKPDFGDLYKEKYKGLAVALEMFSHAMNGNYVNFGVFDLYGDGTLNNSLKLCLSMCLAIPDEGNSLVHV